MNEITKFQLLTREEYNILEVKDKECLYFINEGSRLSLYLGSRKVSNVEEVTECNTNLVDGKFYIVGTQVYYKHNGSFDPICDYSLESMTIENGSTTFKINNTTYRVLSFDSNLSLDNDLDYIIKSSGITEVDCSIHWEVSDGK